MQYVSLYRIYVLRDRGGAPAPRRASVSVIVPTRNEAGNVAAALARTPVMGSGTELIFVEGHSTDDTWATIQTEMQRYRGPLKLSAYQQTGKGKGDAVRLGFAKATGDILMILDADLTDAARGAAELLRRHRERPGATTCRARGWSTRWSRARCASSTSWATSRSRSCSPTSCSSRSRTRCAARRCCGARDYERIAAARAYFGDFDPFGDFDLIFGAARLNLKIVEIPVRYRDRTYGDDQHRSLEARRAAAAHVGDRRPQDQVRVTTAAGRARRRADPQATPPLTEELRARTLERFEQHRRVWAQNRALRVLYADAVRAGRAPSCRRAALGRRVELGSGPGFAREFIPDIELTDLVRAPWHDRRGRAPRRCRSTTAASARWCCSTCSITCRRRGGSSRRRRACWRRAGAS